MQTFLPYPSFVESARVLDRQRLGKQRVEVLQLLNALRADFTGKGWVNHPCAQQWRGYENMLVVYGQVICLEWLSRGYNDTCLAKIGRLWRKNEPLEYPPWLGNEQYHASHRANLLRKLPEYYSQFGWTESPDMAYYWPSKENDNA